MCGTLHAFGYDFVSYVAHQMSFSVNMFAIIFVRVLVLENVTYKDVFLCVDYKQRWF